MIANPPLLSALIRPATRGTGLAVVVASLMASHAAAHGWMDESTGAIPLSTAGAVIIPGPYWMFTYPPYLYSPYLYNPCYPFAWCTAQSRYRTFERRREPYDEQAAQRHEALGAPLPPPGTLSPESRLQPRYRDTGKVRPEFEGVGELRLPAEQTR